MDRPEGFVKGVLRGAISLPRGVAFLVRTPRSWPFAAVPAIVLCTLSVGLVIVALEVVPPWVAARLPQADTGLERFGVAAARYGAGALAAILGVLAATFLTPALSAPSLEHLVRLRERDLGAPDRGNVGFLAEFGCAVRSQLLAVAFGTPVLGALSLAGFIVPGAVVVTLPLEVMVLSLLVAWNLLDYPLSLGGYRLRQRLAMFRSAPGPVLGFGVTFALLFMIPLFSILLLPAAVVAAAELSVALAAKPPQEPRAEAP